MKTEVFEINGMTAVKPPNDPLWIVSFGCGVSTGTDKNDKIQFGGALLLEIEKDNDKPVTVLLNASTDCINDMIKGLTKLKQTIDDPYFIENCVKGFRELSDQGKI